MTRSTCRLREPDGARNGADLFAAGVERGAEQGGGPPRCTAAGSAVSAGCAFGRRVGAVWRVWRHLAYGLRSAVVQPALRKGDDLVEAAEPLPKHRALLHCRSELRCGLSPPRTERGDGGASTPEGCASEWFKRLEAGQARLTTLLAAVGPG